MSFEACVCTAGEKRQYLSRLSRSLLDRIDLHTSRRRVRGGAAGDDATARTGGQPPGLSAHGHDRVLEVARTTADLAECERIAAEHMFEVV